MFNNLFSEQEPAKDEHEFRRVDGDRVYPSFWRLGDDFYFKPNTPLSISFSYFEFLDYLIRNYSEFINKDIVYLYTHNRLSKDDARLHSFKVLYKDYKRRPIEFKKPADAVFRMKMQFEFEANDEFSLYDGPSEVEMVLKSGHIVVDESGDPIVETEVIPDYNQKFIDKFGDYYKNKLNRNPITCYEKYACFCWAMANGFDVDKLFDYKFSDDEQIGWSACLKLLDEDVTFLDFLYYPTMDSYVISRLVTLYELYGFNPTKYIKYGDCSSYKIVEQLLFNGYDTSVLNPLVVPSEYVFMVPLCIKMYVPFMELFSIFREYTLHAACCIKMGIPKDVLVKGKFKDGEWEELFSRATELVFNEKRDFTTVVMDFVSENITNYKDQVASPRNDLFLRDLKKIR